MYKRQDLFDPSDSYRHPRATTENKFFIGRNGSLTLICDGEQTAPPDRDSRRSEESSEHVSYAEKRVNLASSLFVLANAIVKALELRLSLEGVVRCDGLMLWLTSGVYVWHPRVLDVNAEVTITDLAGTRWADLTMSHKEAFKLTKGRVYLQLGPRVPSVLRLISEHTVARWQGNDSGVGIAGPVESHSVDEWYAMTVFEFCCEEDSKGADERYQRPGIRVIRLTEKYDMTNAQSVREVVQLIEDPRSGHVVVIGSIPCTLGCTWHRITRNRWDMQNPGTLERFEQKLKNLSLIHI